MDAPPWPDDGGNDDDFQVLRDDGDRVLYRARGDGPERIQHAFMPAVTAAGHPTYDRAHRLAHEFSLKSHLDPEWAIYPLELVRERGRTLLWVDYPSGEWLDGLIGAPMDIGPLLRIAVGVSAAVGRLHGRGLVHKDLKPSHILVDPVTGRAWLTGFGIASRLPREKQAPEPPEMLAGTLAYMSPEQTGRMNRSIDSRSDLYSLGVTLYQMLTGSLPFAAADAMAWVHCHIARQPSPLNEQRQGVPTPIAAITMKLLAKTAEDRYQSAAAAERDLRRCLAEWEAKGRIDDFEPGQRDAPDRLLIPEKLYGREREVDALLAGFERVVVGGKPELVLVAGYSGIGKSAVVHELHKSLVSPRGLFAAGKFDQYKRDIPYATLAQAFQSLVRPLLSQSNEELSRWREALHDALGPNGRLIVNLVPDLTFILGEQPPLPELPPQEAQRRFQLVVRRFVSVFARPEHPLALFFDDLQWFDAATLDLIEDLLTHPDVQYLFLVGAYRSNEVVASHPLLRKLEAIRSAGGVCRDIVLGPLGREDLTRLLTDALHCEPQRADLLAPLIHEKTTGNPFFAIQFITELADENLLAFDYDEAQWSWDLNGILAKEYTDNVVALMIGKLERLREATQEALQQFACLGNSAGYETLQLVLRASNEQLHDQLWEAVRVGLIFRSDTAYHFLHDRVQEAAYSSIPEEARAAVHLRIGALLAAQEPREPKEIFEIVHQLNRGSHAIEAPAERERLAELNLIAGRRAKASSAYASALAYLRAGSALLTEATWLHNHELAFATQCLMAECELLTAELAAAERRLTMLAERTRDHHVGSVARLRLTLYTTLDRSDLAVDVFLDYMRREGTVWPRHPTRDDVQREYDRIWPLVGTRAIEDLLDLPLLTDPDVLDTLDVFTEIVTPALFFDENLSSLVVCRMVSLSLQHGNCDASSFGYVWFAMFAGPRFNNYRDGFRFGQLGYDLIEKRGLRRYRARTYISFGTLMPWAKHAASGRELVRRAFDVAYAMGDLTFAAYSWHELITNYLMVGDRLGEVQTEAETGLAFATKAGFGLVADNLEAQLGLIRTLRGQTAVFGSFDGEGYRESDAERHFAGNSGLALAEFFYWTRKLQARFFAGDYAAAVAASRRAQPLLWTSPSQLETADYRFYGALAHAACWSTAPADEKQRHVEALVDHHQQLEIWAEHCPTNFESRAAVAAAEIARIEGRILAAEALYEAAIESAHQHGFLHNEAIANERAALFHIARGFEKAAYGYLRDARHCYGLWGADGKVRQLELLHPRLVSERAGHESGGTMFAAVEQLDLATVIKVSQAVSGEIVLEKLIETLMRTAIEHAGAERGLLILPRAGDYWIEAEARTGGNALTVEVREACVTPNDLPESVLHYVVRTHDSVLLHDAVGESAFAADRYVREHQARSVLCLPLLKQARLLGVLYLENHLTAHAFTPARMAVLKLLASEAATSLENTRLYGELQAREVRIRRLFDANIIGIFIWNLEGQILDANDAFLHIVGYSRDDLAGGRMGWKDLMPSDWSQDEDQRLADMKATGVAPPFEGEYYKKDGSRVPVLLGAALLDGTPTEGVAFVLDLSDRTRAEEAARESERRLHEVRVELEHANRVATVGQLSASIVHEVSQPLSGIVTNAGTGMRMLSADPPNVEGASETMRRTIRDANRAVEVITRLRALFAKNVVTTEVVDLNEVTREVIAFSSHELQKNGVALRSALGSELPLIRGSRVQLQQVILNLILNASDAMRGVTDRPRELWLETVRHDGAAVRLTVRDTGIGFEPRSAEQLFDPFYTTKTTGMGLGLSISRSIIETHLGRLWAASNEGPGAEFSFSIPAADETV